MRRYLSETLLISILDFVAARLAETAPGRTRTAHVVRRASPRRRARLAARQAGRRLCAVAGPTSLRVSESAEVALYPAVPSRSGSPSSSRRGGRRVGERENFASLRALSDERERRRCCSTRRRDGRGRTMVAHADVSGFRARAACRGAPERATPARNGCNLSRAHRHARIVTRASSRAHRHALIARACGCTPA
jgi:hypothetical protein